MYSNERTLLSAEYHQVVFKWLLEFYLFSQCRMGGGFTLAFRKMLSHLRWEFMICAATDAKYLSTLRWRKKPLQRKKARWVSNPIKIRLST